MPPDDDDARSLHTETLPVQSASKVTSVERAGDTSVSTQVLAANPSAAELDEEESFAHRYQLRAKIGEGGMGEVHLGCTRAVVASHQ